MLNFANPAGNPASAVLFVLPVTASLRWEPSDMIPGWAVDGDMVQFPISSLPNLSAATADGLFGDARQVAASLLSAIFAWYNEQGSKPAALTAQYRPGQIVSYGTYVGKVKSDFRVEVILNYPEGTVASE